MLADSVGLIVCKVEDKKLWGQFHVLRKQFHGGNLDAFSDECQNILLS